MRICLLTDTHMGARNNCLEFNTYFFRFWNDVFFPELERRNIKTIIHLGDLGEYKKQVNFNILNLWNHTVFERLRDYECYFLVGNHDSAFFRHHNHVNLQQSIRLEQYGIHTIAHNPERIQLGGVWFDFVPWLNATNHEAIMNFVTEEPADVLCGHLETIGAKVSPSSFHSTEHIAMDILNHYKLVVSGHFHYRQVVGNVNYIGNPYQITWGDIDQNKGFAILDCDTLTLEYINNPYKIFEVVRIDELCEDIDLERFTDKHIKVITQPSSDKKKLNTFLTKLEKVNPLSFVTRQQGVVLMEEFEEDITHTDTLYYIQKYVDDLYSRQHPQLDKDKLMGTFSDIHREAQKTILC